MSFRHLSAVKTLNGKSGLRDKKYAAIKASAGFSPFISYLKAISKGTTISSSITVRAFMNLLNSWKASGDKFRLTSSNIVRGMRIIWRLSVSSSLSNNSDTDDSFDGPNAKIYSLESMTKNKFFFPDSFSCLPELFYDIFLTHLENGRRIFSNYFSYLIQMFFCFLGLFHFLSPYIKITMKQERCQGVLR